MYRIIEEAKKAEEQYKRYKTGILISIIMLIVYGSIVSMSGGWQSFDVLILIVLAAVVVALIYKMQVCKRKFRSDYKEAFVKNALEDILEDVNYISNSGFSGKEVREFGLLKMGTSFKSEDYLRAKYKGIEFEQADVCIEQRVDEDSKVTYFDGRIIKFRMEKSITAMQLFSNKYKYRKKDEFCKEKVELEDVEFNKMFDVYAYRQQDAFYILTPQLMEKFKDMSRNYLHLAMSLKGDSVIVALWGHDSFEPGKIGEVDYFEEISKVKDDIQNTIDILKLLIDR